MPNNKKEYKEKRNEILDKISPAREAGLTPSNAIENLTDKKWRKKNLSKKLIIQLVLASLVVLGLLGYIIYDLVNHGPISTFLSNRDEIVEAIRSFGIFGPLFFILISIIQTVVAPIPGQIIGSVGGFLFGWWGILWTLIGNTIGCYIVFKLSKIFGHPLLEKIFKPAMIEKFDFILGHKAASLVVFLIFLLPGFPDDLVCYIAGLTPLSVKQLVILVTLGHLPGIVLVNYMGSGLTENTQLVVILALATVIVLGIFTWQRERIMSFLKSYKKDKSIEENKKD